MATVRVAIIFVSLENDKKDIWNIDGTMTNLGSKTTGTVSC